MVFFGHFVPSRSVNTYIHRPIRERGLVENLVKSPDTRARESLSRGVRNAINESEKAVNCGVRVDGGI